MLGRKPACWACPEAPASHCFSLGVTGAFSQDVIPRRASIHKQNVSVQAHSLVAETVRGKQNTADKSRLVLLSESRTSSFPKVSPEGIFAQIPFQRLWGGILRLLPACTSSPVVIGSHQQPLSYAGSLLASHVCGCSYISHTGQTDERVDIPKPWNVRL